MNGQLALKLGKVRHDHPVTARKAAEQAGVKAPTVRMTVLNWFVSEGFGATDDELFAAFPHIPQSSLRPRRVELVEAGLLRNTGRTRLTRYGSEAIVWKITAQGAEVAK